MDILFPALSGKFKLATNGPLEAVRLGYKQFGDIFRLRIFNQGITVMLGPAASQVVFEASDKELSQKEVYGFTVPVFGRNIVYDAPEGVMVQQLKFVRHSLAGPIMKTHVEKIIDETQKFFADFPNQGRIDLKQSLGELTILTASRCLLGKEVREFLHNEVADLYECLNKGMTQLSFFFPRLPTKGIHYIFRNLFEIIILFLVYLKIMGEGRVFQSTNLTIYLIFNI
jgi:sterol 14-demethylase